jgi:glucuronoarabinoxylan endo-1,4-beta-xylanase
MSGKHYCLYFLIAALFSFTSISFGDINVITNPGFETGDLTGWTPRSCPVEIVTSPTHSGSYSARVYNRTQNWQGIQQDLTDSVVEGVAYTISGYVRLENASSGDVQCTVQQMVDGQTTYNWIDGATATDTGWVYLTGSFIPNEQGGTMTQFIIYFEAADASHNFFVDDVSVFGPDVAPPGTTASCEIDTSIEHQEIEGFGAAGAWYENWLTSHSEQEEIYDLLFGDLGLDIYRIRNTYGYDYNYMNNTAVIVNEALQRNPDLKIMISSWSPPVELKSTGALNEGTLAGGPDNYVYDEFAQWWYYSIIGWGSYGIEADYISIQNEPDWDGNDRCLFDPTESGRYAGYDQAFEAVWQKLNAEMGSSMPKMLGPETSGFDGASGYTPDEFIMALPDQNHIYGYAHHLYNCNNGGPPGCGDAPDMYLGGMINFHNNWGSKPLFQTEYEHSTVAWPDAVNLAHLLHNSLAVEGVSGYLYWDLFWATGGLVTVDNPWMGEPDIYTVNSDYYGFKHFSAFIFPGWRRIEVAVDNPSVKASAYVNPDYTEMTVVAINTSQDTDIRFDMDFLGDYGVSDGDIYRTSETENCEFIGAYEDASLMLPLQSVTTLAMQLDKRPVADVGADKEAYASTDAWAEFTLDGSNSYDREGMPLNYHWRWSVGNTDYESYEASPTIQLPLGSREIELIVDDGLLESEPNYCTVNVISPVIARLYCNPTKLVRNSKGRMQVYISLRGNLGSQIDPSFMPVIYPGEIKAGKQIIKSKGKNGTSMTYIKAAFDKGRCANELQISDNSVMVVGRLKSGQYYRATGHAWLVEDNKQLTGTMYKNLQQYYKKWFYWQDSYN